MITLCIVKKYVDMFFMTAHVESVSLLLRANS